jgi:23S rRNA pseudouridine1911/1915/1917 synthase
MEKAKDEGFDDLPEESDDLFEHYRIIADPGQSLLRLDRFLSDRLPNASRNKIQSAVKEGLIRVNDRVVKSNYKIRPADIVTVSLPEPPRDTNVIPENIPLDIIHEDSSILIINKPPGMVVHPAYNNWTGTLVNALAYHFENLPRMEGNEGRPGLVHRIDKDTSGLLVIAKNEIALTKLARQFFEHRIERTYYAMVWGIPDPPFGTINVPIGRSMKDRRKVVAYPDETQGKAAITHYEMILDLRYVSLLKCNLETGRTHQIRSHMKYIGHPIFNDTAYGGDRILKGTVFSKYKSFVQNCFKIIPRQALHAKTLGFVHPDSGKHVQFDSKLPADFQEVLNKWEHYVKYN